MNITYRLWENRTRLHVKMKKREVNDAVNVELHRRNQKITSLTADLQDKTNQVNTFLAKQEEMSNKITSLTADLQDERKAKSEVSAKLDEAHEKMKVESSERRG